MPTYSLKWFGLIGIALVIGGCSHSSVAISQDHSSLMESVDSSDFLIASQTEFIESFDRLEETTKGEKPFDELSSLSLQNVEGLTYIDNILIVNKKYSLPPDYAPGVDPKAQEQVNALIQEMQNQGLNVGWTTSNFRSYEYQGQLYNNYVASYGQEAADTFSARPGFSEHQTGLAFDLTTSTGELITAPREAQWLLDHAAEYGFIVRYQEGKEAITGYQAEPWHLRYIGPRAQEIAQSGLTLEEFLKAESGDYRE